MKKNTYLGMKIHNIIKISKCLKNMNKKDISMIRKQFKPENERLKIKEIYNFYCKKDSKALIFTEKTHFENIDNETQELLLKNFKKLLPSSLDTKLFEVPFENSYKQELLCEILNNSNFEKELNTLITEVLSNYKYDTDIIISFIKATFFKPSKKKKNISDEGEDDTSYGFDFIMCSINKLDFVKKSLKLDVKEQEVKTNSSLDLIVNLNPIEGFTFPTFSDNIADVNKLLYYTGKCNKLNEKFIKFVLGCNDEIITAQKEKEIFKESLKAVIGESTTTKIIHSIYDTISQIKATKEDSESEDGEIPVVSLKEVTQVLNKNGIQDTERFNKCVENMIGKNNHEFKISNILPEGEKAIQIKSDNINIALSTSELNRIKQINKNGKNCLVIEVDDSINIEGFNIKSE